MTDLAPAVNQIELQLPARMLVFGRAEKNLVTRLADPARRVCVDVRELANKKGFSCTAGNFTFAVIDRSTNSLMGHDAVLRVLDASSIEVVRSELEKGGGRWMLPKPVRPDARGRLTVETEEEAVLGSWTDAFELREEVYKEEELVRAGLRIPQVGAVNAVKAHWSVSSKPATVVLPTGTGKTETMVSLLVSQKIKKLLVVVPTDQLRLQIAEKFISLGVLKVAGCLRDTALYPSVAMLKSAPKNEEALKNIVGAAHVIVATMSVIGGMSPSLQMTLAESVDVLFVDEAHHIGARTWRQFKQQFGGKRVIQFTATPYRKDGLRLDGKFIYVYPLRRAQQDGLFKPISFLPVNGLNDADIDAQIVGKVGEQLASDIEAGYSHLAMARTNTIDRAISLHARYQATLPQYAPSIVHNRMPASQRLDALNALRSGQSKIVVCVDMLGEGFDLPDLKIAALHDKHRSEAVTLQFVGRFTRVRKDLGNATVIANVATDDVNDRLKALYAEDADWDHLLSVIGHTYTERERRREDVYTGFDEIISEDFPLETMEPRLSVVTYKTKCTEWQPDNITEAIAPYSTIVEGPFINREARILVYVTRDEERLRWTSVKSPRNTEYNVVMAHWNPDQNLLYVTGSDLKDLFTDVAKVLVGEDAERISGDDVFRSLHGFRRLVLMNLGLSETQRKPVRYSMFMGSDIAEQLETLPGNKQRTLTNLFGQGYIDVTELDEDGKPLQTWPTKATLGCSTKGKIWSYATTNSFSEWVEWCEEIGGKLLNDSITREIILRNVVRPKKLLSLPADKVPLAIAWPERFLEQSEDRIEIKIGEVGIPFFNCEIEISKFEAGSPLAFRVSNEEKSADFQMRIDESVAIFEQISGAEVIVRIGKKEKRLVDFFREDPPHIYFGDGDMLIAADLFVLRRDEGLPLFDLDKVVPHDWTGVNIRKESQGRERAADSIQRFVIEKLKTAAAPYDLIFDDDGAGEVADVVAIRQMGHTLHVDLFHCKYSSESVPGARVGDLYEVCGQSQKSVRWGERLDELLQHLRRREGDVRASGGTRFEQGDMAVLLRFLNSWRSFRPQLSVTIVQPGYSKASASDPHLFLLSATESFLMDTWRIPLTVWCSA